MSAFAAPSLAPVCAERISLYISGVGKGYDHFFLCNKVFYGYFTSIFNYLRLSLVGIFFLYLQKLVLYYLGYKGIARQD